MPLDPKRLARDAIQVQSTRPESFVGRETTGITRAVRAALPAIRKLREARVTWAAIAEAMTRQGIRQRNGEALTASRLTSIVSQVEEQARRQADRNAARADRRDLVGPSPAPRSTVDRFRLPSEPASASPPPSETESEETLRRKGLAELNQLLRKG